MHKKNLNGLNVWRTIAEHLMSNADVVFAGSHTGSCNEHIFPSYCLTRFLAWTNYESHFDAFARFHTWASILGRVHVVHALEKWCCSHCCSRGAEKITYIRMCGVCCITLLSIIICWLAEWFLDGFWYTCVSSSMRFQNFTVVCALRV